MDTIFLKSATLALGLAGFGAAFAGASVPAQAQDRDRPMVMQDQDHPMFNRWQQSWDAGSYDRRHMLIGEVTRSRPYRLMLAGRDGQAIRVDLQRGTVIRPEGLDIAPGERVAVMGYWSNHTFIANRVVLRRRG